MENEKNSKKDQIVNWFKNPKNLVKAGVGAAGVLLTVLGVGGLVKHSRSGYDIIDAVSDTDSFAVMDDDDEVVEVIEYTNEEPEEE